MKSGEAPVIPTRGYHWEPTSKTNLGVGGYIARSTPTMLDQPIINGKEPQSPDPKVLGMEHAYQYLKADCSLLCEVTRHSPTPEGDKVFRQRRPNPDYQEGASDPESAWIWDLQGVKPIPYRLPDLRAADPDEVVWIVEGEKDADTLHGHGLVATTNPHGPGRWQKSYNTEFRGRRVAVIPDNDAPGIEHANKIANSLAGVARSVRIITLPGVGEGVDVSDWMDQGHIAYELQEILAQTPPFEPPTPEDRSTDNADSPKWKESSLLPHARRITEDMKVRGFFVNGDDEFYYFDRQQHQLVWIEEDDPDLQVVLAERYQINRRDPLFGYLYHHLRVETQARGIRSLVRRFSYYDKQTNIVYLDMGAGRVLRISVDTIEVRANGEDSILFMPVPDHSPWDYRVPTKDRLLYETLVARINFTPENSAFTVKQQRLLLLLWMLSFAFESMMPTKVLAVAVGPHGSGKTTMFRTCGLTLFGPTFEVDSLQQSDRGEDDFWVALVHSFFCCYDNIDQALKWLPDALAQVATGVRRSKRQLHTSSKLHRRTISAMLALTARTPTGSLRREDVADRSLLFQLETLPAKRPEFAIQEEVARLRDELMSDYAGMVQRALRVPLDTVKVADSEVRMADFALVATRIGESMGQEIRDLTDETISLIRPAQHKFATEENSLSTLLDIWITRSNGAIPNNGRPVPTQELLDQFRTNRQRARPEIQNPEPRRFRYKTGQHPAGPLREVRDHP